MNERTVTRPSQNVRCHGRLSGLPLLHGEGAEDRADLMAEVGRPREAAVCDEGLVFLTRVSFGSRRLGVPC